MPNVAAKSEELANDAVPKVDAAKDEVPIVTSLPSLDEWLIAVRDSARGAVFGRRLAVATDAADAAAAALDMAVA